jgi:hypothetical protein
VPAAYRALAGPVPWLLGAGANWPVGWIQLLGDGTSQVSGDDGTVWPGEGTGATRAWTRVALRQR